jgi:hypothetical protein
MKIEITRVTSWKDVLNAARFTQRKELLDKEPSIEFKKKIIRAEHSPLRCLMFNIDFYDIPYYSMGHLVRHVHAQPFVSSSRPDVNGSNAPREEQKKTDPVNMRLFLNAQEIINISKVRLCNKAEFKTRNIWNQVIEELRKTEPELANACVPSCVYRGHCPEIKSCGWADGELFPLRVNDYIHALNN